MALRSMSDGKAWKLDITKSTTILIGKEVTSNCAKAESTFPAPTPVKTAAVSITVSNFLRFDELLISSEIDWRFLVASCSFSRLASFAACSIRCACLARKSLICEANALA